MEQRRKTDLIELCAFRVERDGRVSVSPPFVVKWVNASSTGTNGTVQREKGSKNNTSKVSNKVSILALYSSKNR